MSFDDAIHADATPDPGRPTLAWRRVLMAVVATCVVAVWSPRASASCGDYLYRNGKQVSDSSLSMNDHAEDHAFGEVPVGMPVPPCHGPNCSGNPIPLAPVPAAPTNLIRGFDLATLLESLPDSTPPSGAIDIPESERGARFVPSSIFRPPAA